MNIFPADKAKPETIVQYVEQYGGQDFVHLPLNDVDSLVLSTLTYMDFRATAFAVRPDFHCTMRELESLVHADILGAQMWDKINGRKLMAAAARSRRFGDLMIHDFELTIDQDRGKQFMAVAFELSTDNGTVEYIAFRGTDDTLAGWKEDFELSYSHVIPSQREAVVYVQKIADKYHDAKLILGGHSKGGNLAVYAGLKSSNEVKQRIEAIYDHDGPGFLDDTFTALERKQMAGKIHKSVPESAIVGLLMEVHYDKYTVVHSNAHSIFQHDPLSWLINGRDFDVAEQVNDLSKYTNRAIISWVNQVDVAKRRQFIDALYQILTETGATTIPELSQYIRHNFRAMYDRVKNVDPDVKELIGQTMSTLLEASTNELKRYAKAKVGRR